MPILRFGAAFFAFLRVREGIFAVAGRLLRLFA